MLKAEWVNDGVSENYTVGSFIERFCNISKSLLSCRIPNIKSDWLPIMLDPLDLEIHPDRTEVICLKCIITVSYKQTRFAYPTISND